MEFKYGIVIVTYNRINLLKECVEHCINQTCQPSQIIIIDNCSTDGTKEYLANLTSNQININVVHLEQNSGGAGGFYRGIKEAIETDIDWVMLIDDDAILDYDCMENMNPMNCKEKSEAYACVVESQKRIDLDHRRNEKTAITLEAYNKREFECQYASFCGLMISTSLVKKIGFPEKDYFIWFDDTEYCMRINAYSPIIVCTKARLNHKTIPAPAMNGHVRASWKTYYGTRNNIHALKKHKKYMELAKKVKGTVILVIQLIYGSKDDKECLNEAKLFWNAMLDGLGGNLGKNDNYLPGGKAK